MNNNHVFPVENSSNQQQMSNINETVLARTSSATGEFEDLAGAGGGVPLTISTSQNTATTMASQMFYACATSNTATTSMACTNTHPHYRSQGRYHGSSSRPNGPRSRSRQHHRSREPVVEADPPGLHAWPSASGGRPSTASQSRNSAASTVGGRRHAGSSSGSPRDHDALSDTVSHHSVSSAGVPNWASQRQPSQTASIRSGSAASVENGSVHPPAILSKEPSENTLTTTTDSKRALAGSLASFDTSSIINTDGKGINVMK